MKQMIQTYLVNFPVPPFVGRFPIPLIPRCGPSPSPRCGPSPSPRCGPTARYYYPVWGLVPHKQKENIYPARGWCFIKKTYPVQDRYFQKKHPNPFSKQKSINFRFRYPTFASFLNPDPSKPFPGRQIPYIN